MTRSAFFWLLSFGGFAAVSLLCGLLVCPQLVAAWPCVQDKIDRFRRLPPLAKLVLLLFVGAFVVYGSTKTNQVDQVSGTNSVMGASSFGGRISVKCAGEEGDGGDSGNAFHGNAPTDMPQTVRETGYLKVASVLARRFRFCYNTLTLKAVNSDICTGWGKLSAYLAASVVSQHEEKT